MRPTHCVGGLYLTVADLLAPLPINNNKLPVLIYSMIVFGFKFYIIHSRGGAEDTRFEAKAKNTKKSEVKAKDSLPKTNTLEAKDRNARGQG